MGWEPFQISMVWNISVSYTHLDVYKRQLHIRPQLFLPAALIHLPPIAGFRLLFKRQIIQAPHGLVQMSRPVGPDFHRLRLKRPMLAEASRCLLYTSLVHLVLADADLHCLHHHFQFIPGLYKLCHIDVYKRQIRMAPNSGSSCRLSLRMNISADTELPIPL